MGQETKGAFADAHLDLGLLDRLGIGYYQSDLEGNILAINAAGASMFGLTPEQMIGRVNTEALNVSRKEMDRIRRQVLDLGYASNFIGRTPRGDGTFFFMESSLRTRIASDGEVVGFEGVFRDATSEVALFKEQDALMERMKKANARLMGLSALQEQLLYSLSHDLKTPPVVMQGFAELLLRGRYGALSPEQEKPLRTVHRNVLLLVDMVENVLIFSRLLKKIHETIGPVSLSAAWLEAVSELAKLNPDQAALFSPLRTTEQDKADCNREALSFLLSNVARNVSAVAASASEITCEMASSPESITLLLRVQRLDAEHPSLSRLLDSFFVDSTAVEDMPQMGLGLAAGRYLAVVLGGGLYAEPLGDESALFTITLPH